jgi:hypothetical protein
MGPQTRSLGYIYDCLKITVKCLKLEEAPMPESGDNS